MSLRVPALSKGVRRGPETLLGLALVLGGGLAALALRDDAGELTKVVGHFNLDTSSKRKTSTLSKFQKQQQLNFLMSQNRKI